jgi:hypothetical protein
LCVVSMVEIAPAAGNLQDWLTRKVLCEHVLVFAAAAAVVVVVLTGEAD